MLRIQRDDGDPDGTTLALQGRIVAEWAELLEHEANVLRRAGFRVALDLSEVVFIGRVGLEVLGRLAHSGVAIVGASPLIVAMLEQEGIAVDGTTRNEP